MITKTYIDYIPNKMITTIGTSLPSWELKDYLVPNNNGDIFDFIVKSLQEEKQKIKMETKEKMAVVTRKQISNCFQEILIEMPGVEKKDVEIKLVDTVLTVEAKDNDWENKFYALVKLESGAEIKHAGIKNGLLRVVVYNKKFEEKKIEVTDSFFDYQIPTSKKE